MSQKKTGNTICVDNSPEIFADEKCSVKRAIMTAFYAALGQGNSREFASGSEVSVIVGCSGGLDSQVLLHALVSVTRGSQLRQHWQAGLRIVVAHVNYGLRKESVLESEFVKKFADELGLIYEELWVEPPWLGLKGSQQVSKENTEAWARGVRYQFFSTLCDKYKPALVTTAHHRGDEVETFFFRLLSGRLATSSKGIRMICLRERLVRPLLSLNRRDIFRYANLHNLKFWFDSSNWDLRFSRNQLRHFILPSMRKRFNPRLEADTACFLKRLEEDEDFIMQEAERSWMALKDRISFGVSSAEILELPSALRWRVMQLAFHSVSGPAHPRVTRLEIERIFSALGSLEHGGEIREYWPTKNMVVRVDAAGRFFFHRQGGGEESNVEDMPGEVMQGAGEGNGLAVSSAISDQVVSLPLGVRAVFSLHQVDRASTIFLKPYSNLVIDRLSGVPVGQYAEIFTLDKIDKKKLSYVGRSLGELFVYRGKKKRSLKRFLQDLKVAQIARALLGFVAMENEVLWIPGVWQSEKIKPGNASNNLAVCCCEYRHW